jgi:excinuclease ABC subunit B
MDEIQKRVEKDERVLCTTLTKRMAEELTKFLDRHGVRTRYIHSDVDTLDRIEIIRELRLGSFDVLVGVNLLREGLDLPEVSLVAILDADKEGFLRSERSLVQTVGRAARNLNGMVIMYADKITRSMRVTIEQTERRRAIQMQYNEEHGITPTQIASSREDIMKKTAVGSNKKKSAFYEQDQNVSIAAEIEVEYKTERELQAAIADVKRQMQAAAKDLDFIEAARLRDIMRGLQAKVKG